MKRPTQSANLINLRPARCRSVSTSRQISNMPAAPAHAPSIRGERANRAIARLATLAARSHPCSINSLPSRGAARVCKCCAATGHQLTPLDSFPRSPQSMHEARACSVEEMDWATYLRVVHEEAVYDNPSTPVSAVLEVLSAEVQSMSSHVRYMHFLLCAVVFRVYQACTRRTWPS